MAVRNMSEQTAVQNPMIKHADQVGWQRVSRKQALQLRGGDSGLFFSDILRQKLLNLNPGIVDETAVNETMYQLNLPPAANQKQSNDARAYPFLEQR